MADDQFDRVAHTVEPPTDWSVERDSAPARDEALPAPARIGRFRVVRLLGTGGFGAVYLGFDEQLERDVAIKLPHRSLLTRPECAGLYLNEARAAASLDHPHIVPVYEIGGTPQHPCYIVSKYIDGTDLVRHAAAASMPLRERVGIVVTIAEALHYAHRKGLVHRDIKPQNILLDRQGEPFLVDFGLALRDREAGSQPQFAGTPPYMSPEQARGEGHRVDGRSDVFSLGVVLYELIAGTRPFRGSSLAELFEQILELEPKPLRQIDDALPPEVERICQKALSKKVVDRYQTAQDLADELRQFLSGLAGTSAGEKATGVAPLAGVATADAAAAPTPAGGRVAEAVPKGLRAFDATDADFFLDLLPGPRDRHGLPECLRFWKSRAESSDPDFAFSVGLMYGPSGCGKTSLVRAGLLPRLESRIVSVCVECTGQETEAAALRALRRRLPALAEEHDLARAMASVRRGALLEPGQKLLLVLDQFEQWLHANAPRDGAPMARALRQCDGERLACLILVRDDFWLSVCRFFRALEVPLLDGGNSALVDLFDSAHAREVLARFGRAYGRLGPHAESRDQREFLDRAIAQLGPDGRVVPVQLALFAEMVKLHPWQPATLRGSGGAAGLGATFLEQTFAGPAAPPGHRVHAAAARNVLELLLPDGDAQIKGHRRSRSELLAASTYAQRPALFDELLRVLDGELRLITPLDPHEDDRNEIAPADNEIAPADAEGGYQLTHDYLVPSVRAWLKERQQQTMRGRAALALAETAAEWNARPARRRLPSLWQWMRLTLLTSRTRWRPAERLMMAQATVHHLVRLGLAAMVILLFAWAIRLGYERQQARGLRDRLLDASLTEVPAIVEQIQAARPRIDPLLRDALREARQLENRRRQLNASLALLPVDSSLADDLLDDLLRAEPAEIAVLRSMLAPFGHALAEPLWAVAFQHELPGARRLNAASALAGYDAGDSRWNDLAPSVCSDLVAAPAVQIETWAKLLLDVRHLLLPHLEAIFADPARGAVARSVATDLIAHYAAESPQTLTRCLLTADPGQFERLFESFGSGDAGGRALLNAEISAAAPEGGSNADAEDRARRRANAAIALARLSDASGLRAVLSRGLDGAGTRARSWLVHRLAAYRVDPALLISELENQPEVAMRRALLLSLGEYDEHRLPRATRQAVLPEIRRHYGEDPDAGLHAAAEWLLRRWGDEAWLNEFSARQSRDAQAGAARLGRIAAELAAARAGGAWPQPRWWVNSQGQTLVALAGPVEFQMGSAPEEAGRFDDEVLHTRRINRGFLLSSKFVTLDEYRRFDDSLALPEILTRSGELPVVAVTWRMAARYCNWLSEREGIPQDQWCYRVEGDACELCANYLDLLGYRLPTEAEMEFAIRAGSQLAWFFGGSVELLEHYAWYQQNAQDRPWPVGRLKPNDFGLFDAHGNVFSWCQERFLPYAAAPGTNDDVEDSDLKVDWQVARTLRGGGATFRAHVVRSATRFHGLPGNQYDGIGFRLARRLPERAAL